MGFFWNRMKGAVLGRDEPCKLARPRAQANELDYWCSQTLRPSQTTSDVAVIEHEGLSLIWLGEDMRRSHHLWSIHFFFLFNVVSTVHQDCGPLLVLSNLPCSCSF